MRCGDEWSTKTRSAGCIMTSMLLECKRIKLSFWPFTLICFGIPPNPNPHPHPVAGLSMCRRTRPLRSAQNRAMSEDGRYKVLASLLSFPSAFFILISLYSLSTNTLSGPNLLLPGPKQSRWSSFTQVLLPSRFCLSPQRSSPETDVVINSAMAFASIGIDVWAPIEESHTHSLSAPTILTASNAVSFHSVPVREPTPFAHGRTSAPTFGRERFFQVSFYFHFASSLALRSVSVLLKILPFATVILI